MNIVYILHDDDRFGAAQSFLNILYLMKDKHNIFVINSKTNNINRICSSLKIPNKSLRFSNIVIKKNNFYLINIFSYLKKKLSNHLRNSILVPKALNFLSGIKIDLIHSNSSTINFGLFLAKKLKVRHFWHIREFGDKDYNLVYTFNFKKIIKTDNYFISNSQVIKNHWINKGINENRIKTIYNGFDFIKNPNFTRNSNNKINFLFLGSISEKKGHFLLIKSLTLLDKKYLETINIDIIGSGLNKDILELNHQIKKYDLNKYVNLFNYRNKSQINFNKYKYGLNLSFFEAFGRINIDYIQNGILPLLPFNGSSNEIVFPNYPYLFDSSSPIDLTILLKKCININYDEKLMHKLYLYVSKKFNNYKMLLDLKKYYEKPHPKQLY
jgi:hypothetical protein